MARVNVFLPDELLEAIDAEAADSDSARSALVQEALVALLAARRQGREEAERRRRMAEARRGMDELADKLGDWDPMPIIRRFRERGALLLQEPRKKTPATPRKRRS